jgi:hypothetical protein
VSARRLVCLVATVLFLGACDLPGAPVEDPSPTPGPTALGSEPPDPHAAALTGMVAELRATVAAARDALLEAGTGSGGEAEDAAERAVALLAAEDELAEDAEAPDPRPLFPGPVTSREETVDYGDVFTGTLSAARAAGPAGAEVLDLLRDPVAGDVGAWQRDAEGMLEEIRATARSAGDVAAAEEAVAELDGEGPRALAWALLAADAGDDGDRAAYAERGVAHLDVILSAIDALDDVDATPTPGS